MSFAWVANYIPSEQLLRPERAVECGQHAVLLERMFVTHEADDPVDIAAPHLNVIVVTHIWVEVNLSQPIQLGAERIANLRGHLLDCVVTLHERQRFLWPDTFDAAVKVGPNEQSEID